MGLLDKPSGFVRLVGFSCETAFVNAKGNKRQQGIMCLLDGNLLFLGISEGFSALSFLSFVCL